METFNLAQLTKEMVVSELEHLPNPIAIAANIVDGTLTARLGTPELTDKEIEEVVMEVCKGAIVGMSLMDCPMPQSAVAILRAAQVAGRNNGADPNLVEFGALRGLSDVKRFVTRDVLVQIQNALAAFRYGAGDVFAGFCGEPVFGLSHPGYAPPSR